MGNVKAANGAVTITPSPTQTVEDMNAISKRVEDIGGLLRGSASEREGKTNAQVSNGWLFYETDTGIGYVRRNSGWDPAFGLAPELALYPVGQPLTVNGQANVANWASPGAGGSTATPGWFQYDPQTGDITVLKTGRYSVTARMVVAAANDRALVTYLVRNGSGTDVLAQDMTRTHPTYAAMIKLEIGTIPLSAGERVRMYVAATADTVSIGGVGRVAGELNMRYLGAL